MAAPKGNTNSNKNNRLWTDTIRRVAIQGNGERLRKMAEALFDKAEEGDINAIREIGDRLDGKAAQTIIGAGENGEHLISGIEIRLVSPSGNTTTQKNGE